MGEGRLINMLRIKQLALDESIASKQYKLYDWLNNPIENMKLISEKYPDPLETPEKNKKISKNHDNSYSTVNLFCPKCNSKKFI